MVFVTDIKQFDDLKEEEDNELHIESFKRFKLQKEIKNVRSVL